MLARYQAAAQLDYALRFSFTCFWSAYLRGAKSSTLYFATGMIGDGAIRLLEGDGIAPPRETIRDGTYAFSTELYAVTAGGKNLLIVHVMRSEQQLDENEILHR